MVETPPPVLGPLIRVFGHDPSESDEVLACLLDPPDVDIEDAGGAGRFRATTGLEPPLPRARQRSKIPRTVAKSAGRAPPTRSRIIRRGMARDSSPPPMESARESSGAPDLGNPMTSFDPITSSAAVRRLTEDLARFSETPVSLADSVKP